MLCARVWRGALPCCEDGPVGGLKGRAWDEFAEGVLVAGVLRGPVGILPVPPGVDGAEGGPDICLVGACVHPPRPPRELKEPRLDPT
jgi:hypothetical protein